MKYKFFFICTIFLFISNFLFSNSSTAFINDLQLAIEEQNFVLSELESNSNKNPSMLALNYLELGDNYYKLTKYSLAQDSYTKCLEILTKNKLLGSIFTGDLYTSFSRLYCEIGNYNDALSMAKKALEIYNSSNLPHAQNYKIPMCYNLIAKANGALGNYKESIENAEKAISINPDDNETKIASYHVKGHYICFMALFDEGIEILEKALFMKNGAEDLQTAEICASLANANRNVGDLYKSLNYCEKELEIYEIFYGSENIKIADAYRNLGTAYKELCDYDRAISYIEKAKEIYLASGITTGDSLSACYTNLGCVYSHIGYNEKALENLNEALKIDIKQYGENHSSVATVYNNIASVYADEDLEKAIYYQQKTVEIDTKIFGEKSAKCLVDYLNLALYYNYYGDCGNTETTYLKCLEISEKELGITNPYTIMIYMRLGHFYIAQHNTSKAYDYYQKGIKGYKSCFVSYEDVLGNVWYFLDSTIGFDYITPPPQSLISEMFSVAFEKIEQAMLDNSDNKLDILQYALPLYYYGVMFEISQGNFDKAFEYSESLRGRRVLEQIGSEAAIRLDGLSEGDKTSIILLQEQIAEFKNQIECLYTQTESERDNKLLFNTIKELDNAKKELKKLDSKIAQRIPAYQELKNPKVVNAKTAKKWCGKNRAVLEYVLYEGDERKQNSFAYCLVVTNKKITAVPLDSSYDYNSAISSLREAITHRPIKSEVTFEMQRNELYEKLIQPVLPYIKGVKDVLIVPDGNLSFLPFDILREDSDSADFGKKYSIGVSPSVSVSMIADKVKSSSTDALLFGGAWYDKSLFEEEHNQTLRGNGNRGKDRGFAAVERQTNLSVEDLQNILKNEGSKQYFEQNETADMKDSFSQDDVLGLDGIFWEKPKSQFRLGSLYYNGEGVERNLEKAKYWWEKAAEQGDSDAQVSLGSMYLYGEGVEQDFEKGRYWIEKSVEQGNSNAQCILGLLYWLYYEEENVDQDMEKAEYWLEKSAEQGDSDAQYYLGKFYCNGYPVEHPVERERAIYWFEKLVKQSNKSNNIEPRLYLATLYYEGGDYKKAKYWWEKAAEWGSAMAQNNLGYIYFYGKGVEIDYEEAFYWTVKAATPSWGSSVEAQYRLSEMYEKGLGVPRDYDKAKYWREKADAQKKEEAE